LKNREWCLQVGTYNFGTEANFCMPKIEVNGQ